jgi:hypothetical protein
MPSPFFGYLEHLPSSVSSILAAQAWKTKFRGKVSRLNRQGQTGANALARLLQSFPVQRKGRFAMFHWLRPHKSQTVENARARARERAREQAPASAPPPSEGLLVEEISPEVFLRLLKEQGRRCV